MVFPVGTLCTHAQASGQVEMKEKCCFGSLGSIWDFFFFFLESGSVGLGVLACACEMCITFFAGGYGADVPSLNCAWCSLVLCPLAPIWSRLSRWTCCSAGTPVPGTGTALLVAVPRAWHHLQPCCHHPVAPAWGWWLFLACKEIVKHRTGFRCV